jgi:2-keto-4-pentenoate hydratase/2-oxohepta-3-ene-1,7-dioic acid hydratase in catechol pathway
LPVTSEVWVPDTNVPNEMLCIEVTCELNGVTVQKESTTNLLFTTRALLQAVRDASKARGFPAGLPGKGDILLTGTPGGVAIGMIPRCKLWFGERLPISRMKKLRTVLMLEKELQNSERRFLRPGDRVRISADGLGSVTTLIQQ